ncbi:hypothetical protein Fot_29671 [Forsythia ovata]|uniref:Uncharacterized protein n=1 Tax=Forsythia ovata TaxID=205694 RepID=A0ABD1TSJ2_9LAMI
MRHVYMWNFEDSTGSFSGTMIGDTAEKFLQYTCKQLMDSGSEVLEKIRITLEEEQFFYIKGMKKNVFDNEYKYDIIFLNEPFPSTSTTSTSTRSKTNNGKDIAYTTDTPMPLQGQTFPSAVKQLNFPSSPVSKSKREKLKNIQSHLRMKSTQKNCLRQEQRDIHEFRKTKTHFKN